MQWECDGTPLLSSSLLDTEVLTLFSLWGLTAASMLSVGTFLRFVQSPPNRLQFSAKSPAAKRASVCTETSQTQALTRCGVPVETTGFAEGAGSHSETVSGHSEATVGRCQGSGSPARYSARSPEEQLAVQKTVIGSATATDEASLRGGNPPSLATGIEEGGLFVNEALERTKTCVTQCPIPPPLASLNGEPHKTV